MKSLQRCGWIVTGLIIGTVICEGASRLTMPGYDLSKLKTEWTVPQAGLEAYSASAELGHEARPLSTTPPLDPLGFFSRHSFLDEKKPDEGRLIMLGDSVTAAGTAIQESDLAFLETAIGRSWRKRLKIWHFAVTGYGLSHYERVLRYRASPVRPDLVVILFCINDLDPQSIPVIFEDNGKLMMIAESDNINARPLNRFLFFRSHLYRIVWTSAARWRTTKQFSLNDPGWSEEWAKRVDDRFSNIVSWCEARNVRLAAVVFPLLYPMAAYPPPWKHNYDVLRRQFEKHNLPYLDLPEKLRGHALDPYRTNAWDRVHLNRQGIEKTLPLMVEFLSGLKNGDL